MIDDNSNDNSSYLARNYLYKNNYKYTYIKNSINKGTNYCKNLGLKLSKTKWTIFLDSDDEIIIKSNKLNKLLMKNNMFKLVCLSSISSKRLYLNKYKKDKIFLFREFINHGKGSEVIDCIQKININKPFDENIKLSGEIVGWSRLIKKCSKFIICKDLGRKYYEDDNIERISNLGKFKMSRNYYTAHKTNLRENYSYMKLKTIIFLLVKIIFYFLSSKIILNLKIKNIKP